jgi:hypothetical protein
MTTGISQQPEKDPSPDPPQVAGPSVEELLQELQLAGNITPTAAQTLRENHQYFEENRERILKQYQGRWVAAVNGTLIAAGTIERLQDALSGIEGGDLAYAEEIARS